jgi:hypothetical protein
MAAEEDAGVEVAVYPASGGRAGFTRQAEVGWEGLLYHTMDSSARSKCTDTLLFQSCLAKRCLLELWLCAGHAQRDLNG